MLVTDIFEIDPVCSDDPDLVDNIIEAKNNDGDSVFISQGNKVKVFPNVTSITDEELFFPKKLNILNPLAYSSFNEAGLYSEEFIQNRNKMLFQGEIYKSMSKGITSTFILPNTPWQNIAEGHIDMLDYIDATKISDFILGGPWLQIIKQMLYVLSCIAGLDFLIKKIREYWCVVRIDGHRRPTRRAAYYAAREEFIDDWRYGDQLPPYPY